MQSFLAFVPFVAGAGEEAIALGFDGGNDVATDACLPLSGEDDEAPAAVAAVAAVAAGCTGDTDRDVAVDVARRLVAAAAAAAPEPRAVAVSFTGDFELARDVFPAGSAFEGLVDRLVLPPGFDGLLEV